jgi:hypothetical protein
MIVVPAVAPQALPVPVIVATVGSELIHAPPPLALLCSTQLPTHTVVAPVIADGTGMIVATAVVAQPVDNV